MQLNITLETESLISGIHHHAILLTPPHYQHNNDGCKIMIFLVDRVYSLGCDSMLFVFF